MAGLYVRLAVCIVAELCAIICLKTTEGFTRLGPSLASILLYSLSFYLLSKCLQSMNLSVVYATWSAAGIVLTTLFSMLVYREHLSAAGFLGLLLCIAGVLLLNLCGTSSGK